MTRNSLLIVPLVLADALPALASPPADPEGAIQTVRTLYPACRPVERPRSSSASEAADYYDLNVAIEGDGPRELAFTPDGTLVLIANQDSDTLTFMNASTRQVVGGVTVGDFPQAVAVSPDGQYAVTANVFSNDASIVHIPTRTLLANVPIQGLQAFGVAITPDSSKAVVAVINDAVNSQFTVIDLATRTVSGVIPTTSQGARGGFGTPEFGISGVLYTRFALASNGNDIILPHAASSTIKIYSLSTLGLAASIPVAANASALDVSADSSTVIVAHEGTTRKISVIDLPSRTLTRTVSVGTDLESAGFIRITPSKSHAMCSVLNSLIFVDLLTGSTTSTIATGTVGDIEISFDGQYAFVPNFNASVINIATQTLARSITFAAAADAAVSPTNLRAVALNNRFREDAQFYNINGAAGSFEGRASTGASPEIDCPKPVAISPDGRTIVIGNVLSRSTSIINAADGSVRATIDVGDRVLDVAISPDSAKAVVCNGDSDTVSVINLVTDTLIAELPLTGRPGRVVISPDSQYAYVLNVAGTDRISKLRLTGTPAFVGNQLAGQTGGTLSYAYNEISGITLSPNGSTLAVCDSFNNRLVLIDTATMTSIASPAVGTFPIRAIFNAAGTRAYVSNTFSDDVSVVSIAGAGSATIATISGIDNPLGLALDADESNLYVIAAGTNTTSALYAISTASNTIVKTLNLGADSPRDLEFTPNCNVLVAQTNPYTGSGASKILRFRAAAASTALIDSTPLPSGAADLAYSRSRHLAAAGMLVPDGLSAARYTPTADLTADGVLDLNDFFAFFGGFDLGTAPADVDGDGTIDLLDFFAFFSSFDVGCP